MIDLNKLEELEKATLPPPWQVFCDASHIWGPWEKNGVKSFTSVNEVADYEFIVAVRNAFPELIAEIRRLRTVYRAAKALTEDPKACWEDLLKAIDDAGEEYND